MLEEFVELEPGDSFSRYALALELEKSGEEQEAVSHLKEVIARDSSYVAAYYHLGRVLARTGAAEEAREVYRRGLDVAIELGDKRTHSEIEEALASL
jgi:tetratricopeptide (TPR) repeat protein